VPGSTRNNKAEFRKWHEQALLKTIEAAASGATAVPDEAVVLNGFAAHFLTDAFAAGHVVAKEDAVADAKNKWTTQKFTGVMFKESDFTKTVASRVLADKGVAAIMSKKQLKMIAWGDVTPSRFSEFIYQMADSKPDLFFNAFARLVHDELNKSIKEKANQVEVTNKRGDGPWMLSGDETLKESPDTLKIMQAAVDQSYKNLQAVQRLGTSPPSLYPYIDAAWDYTPVATAAGQKKIDEIVATFTDPKNPKTIDAFAALAVAQVETLVAQLTDEGYMRDKPPPPSREERPERGPKF
jgi:hypothetical protein